MMASWDRDLNVGEVKGILGHRLEHHGNKRLRVDKVEESDDDTIVAETETLDGSLFERYAINRRAGWMHRSQSATPCR